MTAFVRSYRYSFAALLLVAALVVGACGGAATNSLEPAPSIPASDQPFPRTVIDDASIEVTIASEPRRIVALTPASVESLAAWGLSDRVVGVAACTCLPSALASRPQVADYLGTDVEAIVALDPDLVFVGGSGFTPDDAIAQLRAANLTIVTLDPSTVSGVYRTLQLMTSKKQFNLKDLNPCSFGGAIFQPQCMVDEPECLFDVPRVTGVFCQRKKCLCWTVFLRNHLQNRDKTFFTERWKVCPSD